MGRLAGILGAVAGVAVLSASRPADACECIGPLPPALVFPPPGTAAPVDTPIVVAGLATVPGSVVLQRADGTAVPLDETRLELTPYCTPEPTFLRPREHLEPGETYRVVLSDAGDASPTVIGEVTVTDTLRRAEAPTLTIDHMRSVSPPCASCDDVLEVYVDGSIGTEPLWLSVKGSGQGAAEWIAPLTDVAWSREVAVTVVASQPCVELEVIDVTGEAVLSRRLCEPSRCEVLVNQTSSSCGGGVAQGREHWAQIPEGSCDSLTFDAGTPVTPPVWAPPPVPQSPGPDAGVDPNEAHGDQRGQGHESSGCAASSHGPGSTPFTLTALVLSGLVLRRRRTRAPAPLVIPSAR